MADIQPMVNLGDISKPATVLIEKISDAIGGVFRPYQIRRIAEAEAKASLIEAEGQIALTELQQRALRRFVNEEAIRQKNIEDITEKAIPLLEEKAAPQAMESDWIANFFDKCRIVSDGEMQALWSKVLAGEANTPGTYSKRTIDFLNSLDKRDALLFEKLFTFSWWIGRPVPLVYDFNNAIYSEAGIDFAFLTHLANIGLLTFEAGPTRFLLSNFPKRIVVVYFGAPVVIDFLADEGNSLNDLARVRAIAIAGFAMKS